MRWGSEEAQVLQGQLHSAESVTLELFRNALKLADHRGLLAGRGSEAKAERVAFASQLQAVVADLEALARVQAEPESPV